MRFILTALSIILLSTIGLSQTALLTLKVKNIEEAKGKICISIFNKEADYKDGTNKIWTDCLAVDSQNFEHIIPDLPHDTYVISIYHDENSNGEFDTKWYGMPKEAFGFSNDAKGKMGPPKFEDAKFELTEDLETVITLIQL